MKPDKNDSATDTEMQARVARIFDDAPFVQLLEIELEEVGRGNCSTAVRVSDKHLQHLGRAHGAAVTALAGQTALGAAATLLSDDEEVVSPEFKMNLFRASYPGRLTCRATVVKSGANILFVESEVRSEVAAKRENAGKDRLVAKGSFTFMRLENRPGN
ncbi:MAG: PaaI family thioesterase [Balneolaceae bacterium]|nr:PaaI family thioesterase [Balneolaceae bacterium]